ncbi:succinyldiaminopimelate transaminase [Microbacterium amylolyticum]|uniref:Aminotransferase n=1 Tax=Microbacterium amylolyticum TaxID=936337 RepID=A0ABS4ZKD5_9MICO|nr:succinyldiaminopimelate transaminase [Microbacterium amylolyticum]MBP2437756.1 succinyldiaminopimelate transaminase [Microbacterium amylolyticum]
MGISDLDDYPWDSVEPLRTRAAAHRDGLCDLSIGSPVDPTPQIIRDALNAATDAHAYPATAGSAEVREAIVEWYARRRGVPGLSARNVLPTIGSKELVALLPTLLGLGEGDVVVHPRAAYPTYEVGARVANATPVAADDPSAWPEGTKLVWINSPGNPDGRVWDVSSLRAAVIRAREIGAMIASDECYAELGWDAPWDSETIPSILDPRVAGADRANLLSVYSLSKQSNLAGYRAAFVAGSGQMVAQLLKNRKHLGLMPPAPVQHAMAVALADDAHVAHQKGLYRARRDRLKPALESAGFRVDASEAGLYLWATEGLDAWETMARLADLGILAGPGVFYGDFFPQHVRLSLTATDASIDAAASRLERA